MATEHVGDAPFIDDDDDMPPLVDNPYPSMTFTFAANMTPITYSTDPTSFEIVHDASEISSGFISSTISGGEQDVTPVSHNKKKDPGHIPRPPNAFILFRSSFIRAQHIPEKIEGNHSALSKIIGKYWKSLPRQEREVWEAKAIVALAEHKKKYPDWRFKPAATGLPKVKDGPRRRNRKGRGEAEKEVRSREKRCAKIADLLVAGKKGTDLAAAVQVYDTETGGGIANVKRENGGVLIMQVQADTIGQLTQKVVDSAQVQAYSPEAATTEIDHIVPAIPLDPRFTTPLTAMFKRSSSAPATCSREPSFDNDVGSALPADALNSTSCVSSPPSYAIGHEAGPRAANDISTLPNVSHTRAENVNHLPPLQPPQPSFTIPSEADGSGIHHWNDHTTSTSPLSSDLNSFSPSLPAFEPDLGDGSSPIHSPVSTVSDFATDEERGMVPYVHFGSEPRVNSLFMPMSEWFDNQSKCTSGGCAHPPIIVSPQSPVGYDYDGVMKEAFAAASYAYFDGHLDDTNPEPLLSDSWNAPVGFQDMRNYMYGVQNTGCCQDDPYQLFNLEPRAISFL